MPCPHCKAEVAPADVYCISCGARLIPVHQAETVLQGDRPVVPDSTPSAPAAPPEQSGAEASLPPGRAKRRWLTVLLALVLNLALLAASAWLVYAALVRYAERNQPSLSLGAPRLVRVTPRPAEPPPAASPAPSKSEPASPAKPGPELRKGGPAPAAKAGPASAGRVAPVRKVVAAVTAPASATPGPASPPASRPAGETATEPPASEAERAADQVRAGLDAESVRMVVQHHLPQARACYDRALKQQETLRGVVEIQFEVSAEGQVRSSTVFSNNTGHEGLGKCIAAVLRTWRFPRPVGGDVVFVYPFLFGSSGV